MWAKVAFARLLKVISNNLTPLRSIQIVTR